jgi:hypothetical protein
VRVVAGIATAGFIKKLTFVAGVVSRDTSRNGGKMKIIESGLLLTSTKTRNSQKDKEGRNPQSEIASSVQRRLG